MKTPMSPTSDIVFAHSADDFHSVLSTEYQESELTRCESRSSSLKPCYTPSRPSSFLFQSDPPSFGPESDSRATENYPLSDVQVPDTQSIPDDTDTRSVLAPSTHTNRSHYTIRFVRDTPFVISDHNNDGAKEETSVRGAHPINWPSVARIRKSVTSVLQLRRMKFSKPEQLLLGEKHSIIQRAFSSRVADDVCSPKLRRVRSSFARFASLSTADRSENPGDVDGVIEGAKGIVEKTRMQWKFEEMSQEHGRAR